MSKTMPKLLAVHGSLTDGSSMLLVNASNTNCDLGGGVSAAIRRSCGPDYQASIHDALRKVFGGPMAPGEVLLTHAGSSNAKYVAHAAVMDYRQGFSAAAFPDLERIKTCCINLWGAAERIPSDAVTIAMPALGAGTGRLGVSAPTEIALDTLYEHCRTREMTRIVEVSFYGFELHEFLVIEGLVKDRLTSKFGV
jgi:O-acetyl-ADP-ribose deacetylase (regulator of RNase III)